MALVALGPSMASGDQPPRRRTPDHPPYAMMIGEAIRALAEDGGSTEAAISQYIKSNYDDLPWGHDRLLPYYLNKLTIFGEFTVAAPGRYLLADDPAAPPALPPTPDVATPADGSVAVQRRRGRAPKKTTAVGAGGDGPSQTRKRRGRPPKSKLSPLESSNSGSDLKKTAKDRGLSGEGAEVIANVDSLLQTKPRLVESAGDGTMSIGAKPAACSLLAPKRRGRPPKRKPDLADELELNLNLRQTVEDDTETESRDGAAVLTASASKPVGNAQPLLSDNNGSSTKPAVEKDGADAAFEYLLALPHEVSTEAHKESYLLPSLSKHSRRSRKKNPNLVEPTVENDGGGGAEVGYMLALPHQMPRETMNKGDSSLPLSPSPPSKRRGRPPKNKPDLIDHVTAGTGDQGHVDVEPVKAHDVPKSIPMSVDKEDRSSMPNRRGRLPKQKQDMPTVN